MAIGAEALDQLDDTVDVVLLDRMMPKTYGAEALEEIRNRWIDRRVAMVTAVNPDFDIIEMGFDAYVTMLPDRGELQATVERLLVRASLSEELQEYYSLVARRSALQTEKTAEELGASSAYADLDDHIDAARRVVATDIGDMASDTDFVGAVREITALDDAGTDDVPNEREYE